MENLETLEHFETSIRVYERLFRLRPEAVIRDLHPDYRPAAMPRPGIERESPPPGGSASSRSRCLMPGGQRATEPVIAVTLDAPVLDGRHHLGGEWLIADTRGFHRAAWLEPLPLPGGDAGIRNPGRIALAYLHKPWAMCTASFHAQDG